MLSGEIGWRWNAHGWVCMVQGAWMGSKSIWSNLSSPFSRRLWLACAMIRVTATAVYVYMSKGPQWRRIVSRLGVESRGDCVWGQRERLRIGGKGGDEWRSLVCV